MLTKMEFATTSKPASVAAMEKGMALGLKSGRAEVVVVIRVAVMEMETSTGMAGKDNDKTPEIMDSTLI